MSEPSATRRAFCCKANESTRGENLSKLISHDHDGDASLLQLNLSEDRTTRTIPLASRSESWRKRISSIGWLSTSIVHDLRNPLGTVFASAEMLMELDSAPTHVKRLAANIHRAAGRMRELLADLTDASRGNRSTSEICKIRDVIAAASETALPAAKNHSVRILNRVPGDIERERHACPYGK